MRSTQHRSDLTAAAVRPRPLASRPAVVLALAALMVASLVTAATAQGTAVQLNVEVSSGTRTLSVTDLSLAPLTNLDLVPRVASPYRVAVTDTDYLTTQTFTVESETGNLYRVPDPVQPAYDFTTSIPSANVQMGVTSGTLSGLGIDLTPVYTLTATATALADCQNLLPAVPVATANTVDVSLDPIDTLLGSLEVCTALAGLTDLPLVGDVLSELDLDTLVNDLLGLAIGTGGPYTAPSFAGIGAADPAATTDPATIVDILTATPPGALAQEVSDALEALVGLGVGDAVSSVATQAQVLAALAAAGQGTVLDTLGTLAPNEQELLFDTIFQLGLQVPTLADLSNLTGIYTAIPAITVVPDASTVPGVYSGTHTVRLVSP